MTQKSKKLKTCLTFSILAGLLFSCQVEEEFTNPDLVEKNGLIMHKKFDELIQETQFKTAFNKINQPKKGSSHKGGATSKTVMENRYGFTIADYPANVVLSHGIKSYTFLIKRDSIINNVFENLVVNLKENQEPKAFVYRYISTTDNNFTSFKNFIGTTNIVEIEYNPTQMQSLDGGVDCVISVAWECSAQAWHTETTIGCGGGYKETRTCTEGTSGGGGSWSGLPPIPSGNAGYTSNNQNTGSNSGTGSTAISGSGPRIVTAPVGPPLVDPAKDPCTKVQKMKDDISNINSELVTLATKTSELVEHGRYKLSSSSIIQTPPTGSDGYVSLPPPNSTSGQYTMIAHTHNSPASSTYSVFSYEDLEGIAIYMRLGKISPDCVFILPTADGTNYAMTIDDQETFLQFFAIKGQNGFDLNIANDRVNVMFNYYDIARTTKKPIFKESGTDILADKTNFVQMLADLNMGASLMEANANFTNFTKLSYDKKKKIIVPQPCN